MIKMKLTGAQIIVETLIEQGVTDVFGYPGGQVLNIYDELYKNSDRINHILAAHEQGAAHAADGYFRGTGKTGVCIATSGPGATNLVTGIATAMLDSVSMVAITGNVSCNLIGKDSFQEIDIAGITTPITKYSFIVKEVEKLADKLEGDELMDSWEITGDLFSTACEVTPDKQGRILLPAELRQYAGLEKNVTIIGNRSHAEIWATETWETRRAAITNQQRAQRLRSLHL